MKWAKFFLMFLTGPIFMGCASVQVYDDKLNDSAENRSTYYYKNHVGTDFSDFIKRIKPNTSVVVHLHGCAGPYLLEDDLFDFFVNRVNFDAAVIAIDFLKRPGVQSSCKSGKPGTHYETRSWARIDIRRKEAEALVGKLYEKGFRNIFVSGHSEGGRVAQTWRVPVKGILVHGMDCSAREFWKTDQKIIVMLRVDDEWLNLPGRPLVRCKRDVGNKKITELLSDGTSHDPLINVNWEQGIRSWIGPLIGP